MFLRYPWEILAIFLRRWEADGEGGDAVPALGGDGPPVEIVELHGGALRFESQLGLGTKVTVELRGIADA